MRLIACLFALLPLAALGETVDHTNPPALNEYAIGKVKEGDTATALIMLERAARLAPGDEGIRGNLEALRGWSGKGEIAARASAEKTAGEEEGAVVPALWE